MVQNTFFSFNFNQNIFEKSHIEVIFWQFAEFLEKNQLFGNKIEIKQKEFCVSQRTLQYSVEPDVKSSLRVSDHSKLNSEGQTIPKNVLYCFQHNASNYTSRDKLSPKACCFWRYCQGTRQEIVKQFQFQQVKNFLARYFSLFWLTLWFPNWYTKKKK